MIKKLLFPFFILALAARAFSQNPAAELVFYKNEAKNTDKKLLSAVSDNLHFWAARNYSSSNADDALFLAGDIEIRVKNYPRAAITLLRHKYEFPKSPNRDAAKNLLFSVAANFDKQTRAELEKKSHLSVPENIQTAERLSIFLSEAVKLNIKNSFDALFVQFQEFFARFPVYENNDKLELMLGDLYRQNKNYQAAIMQYAKVYEIYPSAKYKAASLRMMGDIYAGELKNPAKAQYYYDTVLKDFPNSAERGITYHHLAIFADNNKDYVSALDYINKATDIFIKDNQTQKAYEALRYKADLQEKKIKNYAAAAETLNRTAAMFIKQQDKYIDAKLAAADIYAKKLKDPYGQIAAYEDMISNYPQDASSVRTMFETAALYEKMNNTIRAKELYRHLIIEHPADSLAAKAQKRLEAIDKAQAAAAAAK
ncbi:MAG: tetratricopeptide repeat protein [Elusimicrobiota bacterium]|jgi:TolA-binding protein|nr:tetratricopeptide repeat protein [Elusimicrobiota bacterium]